MDLKDTMMFYGVTLGSRKTQRKKNLFVQTVLEECQKRGISSELIQTKKEMFTVNSIVIGNLSSAKYVFLTGYDTPVQYFTGLNLYPFHPEKSSKAENIKNLIHFVIVVLLAGCMYLPLSRLRTHGFSILPVLTAALLIIGILVVLFPRANACNFSRSSAVAVLMSLAEEMKGKEDVAYVMSDHTTDGYIGYKALQERIPSNSKVILLGPMASGEKTVVACRENENLFGSRIADAIAPDVTKRLYTEEQASRNSLSLFPHVVYVGCGDIEDREFVIHSTACKDDVQVDMKRLQKIRNGLERGVQNG